MSAAAPPPDRGAAAARLAAEVWGGLLVGGASRRMGRPKQTLEVGGTTLAERAVAALAPHVAGVAALGGGALPLALAHLPRIDDVELPARRPPRPVPAADGAAGEATDGATDAAGSGPGGIATAASPSPAPPAAGPLAGLLAAMRWRPRAAWVFAPCDLPALVPEAVAWLVAQRRPGRWAVLPRPEPGGKPHPLLALYEPPALELLEELAAGPGPRAPIRLAGHPRVATPEVPPELAPCWRGVNTPEELAARAAAGRGRQSDHR